LTQFGSGVFELREALAGDAFRSVYIVSTRTAVYVLHAFKKKSKSGKAIPRADVAVIEQRLKRARLLDASEKDKR
jgi:phage-related protein